MIFMLSETIKSINAVIMVVILKNNLPIQRLVCVSFHFIAPLSETQTTLGGSGSKPCRSHANITTLPNSYDVASCVPPAGRPGSVQTGPETKVKLVQVVSEIISMTHQQM